MPPRTPIAGSIEDGLGLGAEPTASFGPDRSGHLPHPHPQRHQSSYDRTHRSLTRSTVTP
jgi:hypothetical protein